MDKKMHRLMQLQQAREAADQVIRKVSGTNGNAPGGTYLVTSFRRRDDLPVTASLRRMSAAVACRLAGMGLHEPVSLQSLPNRWWTVNIDAAEVGLTSEYGGAFVTRTLSSEALADLGFEVVQGPFKAWETPQVSKAILENHPGQFWDARVIKRSVDASSQRELPFAGHDNAYDSEALLEALKQGDEVQVFSGPHATAEDALYALDLRWEAPE